MFNLEQSIADWREQMLATGINDPCVLDELEGHLREEMQRPLRAGFSEPVAFGLAVRKMGQPSVLKSEFAKSGGTVYEDLKQFIRNLIKIPDHQLATNMNTSNHNFESRWTTYLKTGAYVVPAIFFWVGSCIFLVPKLRQICLASGTAFPRPMLTALALSDLLRNNVIYVFAALLITLVVLEGRSQRWPRYRRAVFGITAFILNFGALVVLATMLVFAVIAGANLLPHAK